jgi:flagellar hook assembly protein FlgD
LPIKDRISLKIYDELGREVRTLINNADYPKGKSEITWNGKNNQGKPVSSGVYFYTLRFGNFQKSMKMTLVK